MKYLFFFFLLGYGGFAAAQSINDVPFDSISSEFLEITGASRHMNPEKVAIELDFGNEFSWNEDIQFKDEEGQTVTVTGMIDALNFFTKYGWEFMDAYAVTYSSTNAYHYLMRRSQ